MWKVDILISYLVRNVFIAQDLCINLFCKQCCEVTHHFFIYKALVLHLCDDCIVAYLFFICFRFVYTDQLFEIYVLYYYYWKQVYIFHPKPVFPQADRTPTRCDGDLIKSDFSHLGQQSVVRRWWSCSVFCRNMAEHNRQ